MDLFAPIIDKSFFGVFVLYLKYYFSCVIITSIIAGITGIKTKEIKQSGQPFLSIILAPLIEETIFRGVFIWLKMPIIGSLLWSICHLPNHFVVFIYTLLFSPFYIRLWANGLWYYCFIFHALHNLIVIIIIRLRDQHFLGDMMKTIGDYKKRMMVINTIEKRKKINWVRCWAKIIWFNSKPNDELEGLFEKILIKYYDYHVPYFE